MFLKVPDLTRKNKQKIILQSRIAYAIIPEKKQAGIGNPRIPGLCVSTVRGFFFSFIVAKHPLGYLLSLSYLSSHLQMRWQATPAITVTIKASSTSIAITSSRCRVSVGQHAYCTTLYQAIPRFSTKNSLSHCSQGIFAIPSN